MSSIEVHDLTVHRASGFTLGPLAFDLAAGSRTAVVGPSGSGKTTLLRCLAGLHQPGSGTVALGGRLVHGGPRPLTPRQRRIGFVFQDGGLWPHLTARGHLRFANPSLDDAAVRRRLDQVELGHRADARPGELSGGEAQRLALARALACDPEILMLDEPLQSVDTALRSQLGLLIRNLAIEAGLTVVLVTHDAVDAMAIADDLLVMQDGRILESGSAESVLREPRTAFGAAFLAGATCIPVHVNGAPTVATAFGPVPCPADRSQGYALVLMPDQVVIDVDGPAKGRVVSVWPGATGCRALVDLAGQAVSVPCDRATTPGSLVGLRLLGKPRLLPAGRPGRQAEEVER